VVVNAVQPLAGWLTAAFRRPAFLLVGPVLAGCMALIGLSDSFWIVAALAILGHIGIGIFHPDGLMAAHVVSGSREHVGVPIFLSGGFFGWSLGALISSQWVGVWGFSCFWLLALPGLGLLLVFGITGLSNEDAKPSPQKTADEGTLGIPFAMIFLLAVTLVTAIVVTYPFLAEAFKPRFGEKEAVRLAGLSIALLGLSGTFSSLFWGWLSARVSPFLLIGLGQFTCVPLYWRFLHVKTPVGLIILSAVMGVVMGGAFFPIIATAARRAKGLTASLRGGIIVGGSWGSGAIVVILCGWFTDYGVTPAQILQGMATLILITAVLSLGLHIWRRTKRANEGRMA
jgi:FSR family fosmidomycin resistance protein-like MFS transporter